MSDKVEAYERKREKYRGKIAESHTKESFDAREAGTLHDTYQFENLMLSYIRDGEVTKLRGLLESAAEAWDFSVGILAADPLRQAKNLFIGLVAVVGKVAGVGGGMDIEDAYRLIDLYTQECEKAASVEDVTLLQYNMVMDFTERVQQAKLPENVSREIFEAAQFVQNSTGAQLSLDDVAEHIGMSRSFLTKRFRAEMGKSVSEYITEMKLRDAKRFLRYSDKTLGEISASLGFSSQPYFQNVFKKNVGVTPMEYRNDHKAV